ncbi:divalent-cation tolerance protein CutA [Novosphingobium guangzhouense]|uniref:Divalent cation transporter n=1 Tax=Novosphingobium guangzhouense TaxID=1850347 RepID=A0A2K2FSM8_9SPHN|nr:divalent-cation tolerance protein CutA [Novosphingobium guangzhouense]PNU01795.1 divalent cation transporter [Novosphingobium guangzhouense]
MTVGALIWCPFPDEDAALAVIDTLLTESLAACANIVPGIVSVYVWKGERGTSREVGVLFKTRADLLDAAIARVAYLHPYDDPAVLGWRCDAGAPQTLAWLGELPQLS